MRKAVPYLLLGLLFLFLTNTIALQVTGLNWLISVAFLALWQWSSITSAPHPKKQFAATIVPVVSTCGGLYLTAINTIAAQSDVLYALASLLVLLGILAWTTATASGLPARKSLHVGNLSTKTKTTAWSLSLIFVALMISIVNWQWGPTKTLHIDSIWVWMQGPYFVAVIFGVTGIIMLWNLLTQEVITDGAKSTSLWADAWRRLKKNKMAVGCSIVFLVIFFASYLGPTILNWFSGVSPTTQDLTQIALDPSAEHWFGTDKLGRDMFIRTLQGGQIAIIVGISATAVALFIGVLYGAIAGYVGGRTDEVMMRIVDLLYAFPRVVFIIVIMSVIQTKNITVLFALLGVVSWLGMARIVRGQVLSLRKREYVEASEALGAPSSRIVVKHIIPNTLNVIIVYSTLSLPSVMLTEAFLSYLGLGVQAPNASWGTLVDEAQALVILNPWLLLCPGLVMAATIFALNFLGDGLRDALDPKMRKD